MGWAATTLTALVIAAVALLASPPAGGGAVHGPGCAPARRVWCCQRLAAKRAARGVRVLQLLRRARPCWQRRIVGRARMLAGGVLATASGPPMHTWHGGDAAESRR